MPGGVAYGIRGGTEPPRPKRRGAPGRGARAGGAGASSALTIGKLASIHDKGGKHLPRRKILVQPNRQTTDGMRSDITRALGEALRRSAKGGA